MRTPRFLSVEEEARLRAALQARDELTRARRDSANRWRAERGYPLLPDLREFAFVDRLTPLVLLSLHTGMRRGEAFGLTWRDVDPQLSLVTVHGATAKSGTTRHIPLNLEAAAILEKWRARAAQLAGLALSAEGEERRKQLERWYSDAADAGRLVFPGGSGRTLTNVRAPGKACSRRRASNDSAGTICATPSRRT
jgi:integrase